MSAPPAAKLAETLRPLTEYPGRAAILLDVDGTLSEIVRRADQAQVPADTSRVLSVLVRRYALVACVSGRSAAEARRLVGVGGVTYAGAHGAELLGPGESQPTFTPAFEGWGERVRQFTEEHEGADIRTLRIRTEDKGAIVAYHWRDVPDEDAARERLEQLASDAEDAGLGIHWGRKVLEVRPPVPFDKGRAVHELVRRTSARTALYAGDDQTDLDAFDALDAMVDRGELRAAVRVGVRSPEGPAAIVERADVSVDSPTDFVSVLTALAESQER